MLTYFVQVQMTRKDNLCVYLTYHNSEKGQVSWGNGNDSTENRTNFLLCMYDNHAQCASTCAKKLLCVFLIWMLIKFQYDSGKYKHCWKGKKDGINILFWVVFERKKNMPSKRVERCRRWGRQRETHFWKPDRMEKEKERRDWKGGDELGWNQSKFPSYFFHVNPHPLIFLLNTEKCKFFPHKSAWTMFL